MKRKASYVRKKTEYFGKTVLKITSILILLENSPGLPQSRHCDIGLEAREISFSI